MVTEQDKENLIATINGMSDEELQIVAACIPDELLGNELSNRLHDARSFKNGVMELLSKEK